MSKQIDLKMQVNLLGICMKTVNSLQSKVTKYLIFLQARRIVYEREKCQKGQWCQFDHLRGPCPKSHLRKKVVLG